MSDDRDHIRQQRRAERERKDREFQEEMARYEAERQARLDARRKAREAESSGSAPSTASSTGDGSASSSSSSVSRSDGPTSTKQAIEENLNEWEEDRKERLAERELDAQERKAALETQLAMEEAERKKKLDERRKQRELERQKEEAEEAARKARLEERRREREEKRLAEEKEMEEKAAARRKAREERALLRGDTDSASSSPSVAARRDSTASNDSSPAIATTLHVPRNDSPSTRTESPVRRKRLGEIGRASDSHTPAKIDQPSPSRASSSAAPSSASTSTSPAPVAIAISASPIPAALRTPSSLHSSTDSISDEIKKEEEERAKEAEDERIRKEKEAEETALLKAAADAEIKAQAEADAKIREEMRKEEEALLQKEKAAEEAAKLAAVSLEAPAATASVSVATSTPSTASPATAAKSSAAAKMRSLLTIARQQQTAQLTGSKVHRFSTTERPIGHIPAPVMHRLTTMELFCLGGGGGAKRLPDPDLLMNHFVREGRLARDCVTEILLQIRTAFLYEKNVVTVNGPSIVVGDIHGQFYDLLHLFRTTGLPGAGENNFVFLGDYVDRGTFSCEVCLVLFACKLRYPGKVTLLRGNHETRAMSSYHNFQKEATHKYGAAIYEMFMEVFDHLPLAAIVETGGSLGRVFCCHGGLGPSFKTIDEIQALDRFSEPEDDGALCDLIWADPVADDKFFNQNFSRNKERGCSVVFGYNPIYDFLEFNNLAFIVRAHQVEEKGYKELHFSQAPPGRIHPMVITLFSAPNYCDSYENMAAYLLIGRDEYNFHQYTWQQHPYCLPDFSNAIKFSLPFVAENIMKFIVAIVETIQSTDLDDEELSDEEEAAADVDAGASMERKLRSVGRSFIVLRKMRESSMGRLGNIIEQQKFQQQQQTSLVSGETQSRIDAARSRGGRRKVQRVVSDLSDIVKMASERFLQAKSADADNERFHGRAAWKSTFRKLGRGVSFKI